MFPPSRLAGLCSRLGVAATLCGFVAVFSRPPLLKMSQQSSYVLILIFELNKRHASGHITSRTVFVFVEYFTVLQQTITTSAVPNPIRGIKWNEIKTNIICITYNATLYRAIFVVWHLYYVSKLFGWSRLACL